MNCFGEVRIASIQSKKNILDRVEGCSSDLDAATNDQSRDSEAACGQHCEELVEE
jgi:hypothetical protein